MFGMVLHESFHEAVSSELELFVSDEQAADNMRGHTNACRFRYLVWCQGAASMRVCVYNAYESRCGYGVLTSPRAHDLQHHLRPLLRDLVLLFFLPISFRLDVIFRISHLRRYVCRRPICWQSTARRLCMILRCFDQTLHPYLEHVSCLGMR